MPKIAKHIHKYERVVLGKRGYTVFRCILPGCGHYIREELATGKMAICNRCENVFIMDKVAITLKKPHCLDCTKRKDNADFDIFKEMVLDKEASK
jgi:hypothetical protein